MNKYILGISALAMAGAMTLAGCGASQKMEEVQEAESVAQAAEVQKTEPVAQTAEIQETEAGVSAEEIQVFIAASLNGVMTDVASHFNEQHPEIKITFNADSSGTLLEQIENGFECDIFFSAAQKQVNKLEEDGLILDGARANVVNNQVCVVTRKNSGTAVTGLMDLDKAESIALADGSVPVGKYTRQALVNAGVLEGEDAAEITTTQVSEALGGVEISEQGNVSKVRTAVIEGSCEVGTVYYSDTYGYEDELEILEMVSYDLTGNVIYPVCLVVNDTATEAQVEAARLFYDYILSDEAKALFDTYLFDTNVER